jgi:hypothetical protein
MVAWLTTESNGSTSALTYLPSDMGYLCYTCRSKGIGPNSAPTTRPLLQYQLHFSKSGGLSLIRPPVEVVCDGSLASIATARSQPWILKLPDELLVAIFETVMGPEPRHLAYTLSTHILAIGAVCHRFYEITKSIIYHTVRFETWCGIAPPCYTARCFYRTITDNHSLRPLCKELMVSIYLSKPSSVYDYELAHDLSSKLPNIRCFSLQGGFSAGNARHTWTLIQQAVKHMPLIEHVSLSRMDFRGLTIPAIIENLNLPKLKSLRVTGINSEVLDQDLERDQEDRPPVPKVNTSLLWIDEHVWHVHKQVRCC